MVDKTGTTTGNHDAAKGRRFSPATARRRLGEELRSIREKAGLNLADAAAAIERSAPTLSRLENGKTVPRLVDIKALLDQYAEVQERSVPAAARERLIALAHNGREEEWFTSFRDVLNSDMTRDDVARYVAYEDGSEEIRSFEPDLVPGLLQTRGYATHVVAQYFPDRSAEERARLVEFRLARQQVLERPGGAPRLRVVVGEYVVRRALAPDDDMREQRQRLLECARGEMPNVELRIAPASLGIPAAVGGPFVVMSLPAGEPDLIYLESREGAQYRQDEATRSRYSRYFDDLLVEALDPKVSGDMIEEVLAGAR